MRSAPTSGTPDADATAANCQMPAAVFSSARASCAGVACLGCGKGGIVPTPSRTNTAGVGCPPAGSGHLMMHGTDAAPKGARLAVGGVVFFFSDQSPVSNPAFDEGTDASVI